MRSSVIETFLNAHSEYFESGDLTLLAPYYRMPIAVYFRDELEAFSNLDTFFRNVTLRRQSYQKQGVAKIHGRVSAVELVHKKQFRVWVNWQHTFADGMEQTGAEVIYYCREVKDGLEVQLVQTSRCLTEEVEEAPAPSNAQRPAAG